MSLKTPRKQRAERIIFFEFENGKEIFSKKRATQPGSGKHTHAGHPDRRLAVAGAGPVLA